MTVLSGSEPALFCLLNKMFLLLYFCLFSIGLYQDVRSWQKSLKVRKPGGWNWLQSSSCCQLTRSSSPPSSLRLLSLPPVSTFSLHPSIHPSFHSFLLFPSSSSFTWFIFFYFIQSCFCFLFSVSYFCISKYLNTSCKVKKKRKTQKKPQSVNFC